MWLYRAECKHLWVCLLAGLHCQSRHCICYYQTWSGFEILKWDARNTLSWTAQIYLHLFTTAAIWHYQILIIPISIKLLEIIWIQIISEYCIISPPSPTVSLALCHWATFFLKLFSFSSSMFSVTRRSRSDVSHSVSQSLITPPLNENLASEISHLRASGTCFHSGIASMTPPPPPPSPVVQLFRTKNNVLQMFYDRKQCFADVLWQKKYQFW